MKPAGGELFTRSDQSVVSVWPSTDAKRSSRFWPSLSRIAHVRFSRCWLKTVGRLSVELPLVCVAGVGFVITVFAQIMMLWASLQVIVTWQNNLGLISVPHELLLHSPVLINFTVPPTGTNRMSCNPHFYTFLNNESYFTDDFRRSRWLKV